MINKILFAVFSLVLVTSLVSAGGIMEAPEPEYIGIEEGPEAEPVEVKENSISEGTLDSQEANSGSGTGGPLQPPFQIQDINFANQPDGDSLNGDSSDEVTDVESEPVDSSVEGDGDDQDSSGGSNNEGSGSTPDSGFVPLNFNYDQDFDSSNPVQQADVGEEETSQGSGFGSITGAAVAIGKALVSPIALTIIFAAIVAALGVFFLRKH